MELRLYSIYDTGTNGYMLPFWQDHKTNAIRQFTTIVNRNDPNDKVCMYPEQFVLFEIATFDQRSGVITPHSVPISLGVGSEYIRDNAA